MKIKRLSAMAAAFALALSSSGISSGSMLRASETEDTGTAAEKTVIMSGDIDGDGIRDITDLTMLSLYLIKDQTFTEAQMKAADIDKDGKASFADLAYFRQYISKVNDVFEESEPLLAIVYENYAWGHVQRMTVMDSAGRIYGTDSCEDESEMTDMSGCQEGITRNSKITEKFRQITDNAELRGTASQEVISAAVNARDSVYVSDKTDLSKSASFMNDYGVCSLYLVSGDSLVRVAEYGDVTALADQESVDLLVSALALEKIYANTSDLQHYYELTRGNRHYSEYDGTEFETIEYKSECSGVKFSSFTNYYPYDPSCSPSENSAAKLITSAEEYEKCFGGIESGRGKGLMDAAKLPDNYFDEGNAVVYMTVRSKGENIENTDIEFSESENRINLVVSTAYRAGNPQCRCWNTLICVPKELLAENSFVNDDTTFTISMCD